LRSLPTGERSMLRRAGTTPSRSSTPRAGR
jgi:hypothetical protein